MSSILSADIISVVVPDSKIFDLRFTYILLHLLQMLLMLILANGLITFFINGNPVFNNGPKRLPRNPPYCIILDNWVLDSIISVDNLLAKTLRILATCLLLSNKSWKLVSPSELPTIFDDDLKTTSVSFFVADFNLLSCEFHSFTFKLLYWVILYW